MTKSSKIFREKVGKKTSTPKRTVDPLSIDGPDSPRRGGGLAALYHSLKTQKEEKKQVYEKSKPIAGLIVDSIFLTRDEFAAIYGGADNDFVKYIIRETGWENFHGKILKSYVYIESYSGILTEPNIEKFLELESKIRDGSIKDEEQDELAEQYEILGDYPEFYMHVTNKRTFNPSILIGCHVEFFDINTMEYGEIVSFD